MKQSVLLSYVFSVFSLTNTTQMQRSRDLDFDLELYFLRNPYKYVSSACMQNFINIHQRKLWVIPTFICN